MIDEKKAIEITKKLKEVVEYTNENRKLGLEIVFYVNFNRDKKTYLVICQPKNRIAGTYEVELDENGKILSKIRQLEG